MDKRSKTRQAIYEAMIAFPAVDKQHARTALARFEALIAELNESPERGVGDFNRIK